MLPSATFFLTLSLAGGLQQPPDPMGIVGGSPVEACGWPTTVYTGGCTATLVHPKAISTAQHCGSPSAIQFGTEAGMGPTVAVLGCVGDGSQDAMLCELAEEVTQVPVTPVLFGCEADMYLQPGQPVAMAGFGQTSFGMGGGTKLWAPQTIAQVEAGRVIVGEAGDGTSPCPGDSGGPVFVQVADGTWRVFGTVLGGTTGTPCNSAADFQRIDTVVPNFESQTGLDITPCFDGQTGAWDPGPACGGFFAGDHTGAGSWDNWCEGIPAGGYSDACGDPFGEDPDGSTGGPGDETDGPQATNGDSNGTGSASQGGTSSASNSDSNSDSGDDSDGSGDDSPTGPGTTGAVDTDSGTSGAASNDEDDGGCNVPARPAPPGTLVLLGLAGLLLRRRNDVQA